MQTSRLLRLVPLTFVLASGVNLPAAPASVMHGTPKAPLTSARCAQILWSGEISNEYVPPGWLTREEYARISSVPSRAHDIRLFLSEVFPGLVRGEDWGPAFRALWRRIPELRAPAVEKNLRWTDVQLEHAWMDFRLGLRQAMIELKYRPPRGVRIAVDSRVASHLRGLDSDLPRQIRAMPFEARDIYEFLRERYPSSPVRVRGWLDRRLDLLWAELFGTGRRWSIVRPPDGYDILGGQNPVAERRLLDEWRLILITLNLHPHGQTDLTL